MTGKRRIAAYTRVSTTKDEQMNSLENQRTFFEDYAKINNFELVNIYTDEGLSGLKLRNRAAFLKMMEDARKGLFEIVITKGLDRFSRNTLHFLQYIRELRDLGIDTIFLTNNLNVIGQGELTLGIFSLLAQEESSNISKRTKWGKEQRSRQEGSIPTCVFGYDSIRIKTETNRKKAILQINEIEADVIRLIFSLYTTQDLGALRIANELNERGFRTKRNSQWTQAAICRTLANELYTGKVINRKQEITDYLTSKRKNRDREEWIVHEYPDLAIIDRGTFEKAQTILKQRHTDFKVNRTRQSNRHLFSTIIKCAECGYSFRRYTATYANTYYRWICSGRNVHGKSSCSNNTVLDEQELLGSIRGYFTSVISDKKAFFDRTQKEFKRIYAEKDLQTGALNAKDINKRITRLKKKREKTLDLFTDGIISKSELQLKLEPIDKEINAHEKNLDLIGDDVSKPDIVKARIDQLLYSIENIMDDNTLNNAGLKQIIEKITVNPEGEVTVQLKKI